MEEPTGDKERPLSFATTTEGATQLIHGFSRKESSTNACGKQAIDVDDEKEEGHELFITEELDPLSSSCLTDKTLVRSAVRHVDKGLHYELPRIVHKGNVLSVEEVRKKGHELFYIEELDPVSPPTSTVNHKNDNGKHDESSTDAEEELLLSVKEVTKEGHELFVTEELDTPNSPTSKGKPFVRKANAVYAKGSISPRTSKYRRILRSHTLGSALRSALRAEVHMSHTTNTWKQTK